MNCGRRREAAMRRFRFRRVRHVKNGTGVDERITDEDYDEDQDEKELLEKVCTSDLELKRRRNASVFR